MNELAMELNKALTGTNVYEMLSDYGKRMYVPNGIVLQSAEAKQKAKRYNATIGTALEGGVSMYMPSVKSLFSEELSPAEIFAYSPMGGNARLRELWAEEMREKNPTLRGKKTTLPVVCGGLTSALSLAFSLFADKGDSVVLPDLYWENYNLIIDEQREAKKVLFDMFTPGGDFNVEGLKNAVLSVKKDKVLVILNFPNNPTGYTPTQTEAKAICAALTDIAESGKKLVVFSDDAYFGLFFEDDVNRESLFATLCDASPNLLAIKCDGATKEEMAWGFRIAFLTYGFKGATEEALNALTKKTLGSVRGSFSNCSTPAQSILLRAMQSPTYVEEKKAGVKKIGERYKILKDTLSRYKDNAYLTPYPFNSGYFMSFHTACPAETLRQHLLNVYETGSICVGEHVLRLAFSSVDADKIESLVSTVYQAAEDVCKG